MVAMVGCVGHYVYLLSTGGIKSGDNSKILGLKDDTGNRLYYHRNEVVALIPQLKDAHGNRLYFTEEELTEKLIEESLK